jgi:hydroxymethylpyrimidine/phosphomethylpyrimidine kinase
MKAALTIAGSDSGGGAGIQADLKTFEAHEIYGTTAITALTAQNTVGVQEVMPIPVAMVIAQLHSILDDFEISAGKTGMLFSAEIIHAIAETLRSYDSFPLVVDPVMVATSGDPLLEKDAIAALQQEIFPLATLITPNLSEAALLANITIEIEQDMLMAAEMISEMAPEAWILIKGGHLQENPGTDLLFREGHAEWLRGPYIETLDTHGTGCTLSAAIAARLSMGVPVPIAVRGAKEFMTGALKYAWHGLGKGRGSLRHHYYHNVKLFP